MTVEVLRHKEMGSNENGEYYVVDDNGNKYFVIQNNEDYKMVTHEINKLVKDCLVNPNQVAIREIKKAVRKYKDV